MNLNLDIANILVIKKMYELRNVKRVAESLGKTSGAISKNLYKLKTQLNDPLFVQTRTGFEPTAFVEANMENFEKILTYTEAIKYHEFSPVNLSSTVIIYGNSLFWDRYGDHLFLSLIKEAPNAKFSFRWWSVNSRNSMIEGDKLIAIHPFDDSLPKSISQKRLTNNRAVFFVRKDHPAKDLETLMKYPMVVLKTPTWNDYKYHTLERLSNAGYHKVPIAEVECPIMNQNIVLQSDHFGLTMTGHIPKGCRGINLPHIEGLDISYVLSCRRSQQSDPLTEWVYEKVLDITQSC